MVFVSTNHLSELICTWNWSQQVLFQPRIISVVTQWYCIYENFSTRGIWKDRLKYRGNSNTKVQVFLKTKASFVVTEQKHCSSHTWHFSNVTPWSELREFTRYREMFKKNLQNTSESTTTQMYYKHRLFQLRSWLQRNKEHVLCSSLSD